MLLVVSLSVLGGVLWLGTKQTKCHSLAASLN
jgi:hypothetical protein